MALKMARCWIDSINEDGTLDVIDMEDDNSRIENVVRSADTKNEETAEPVSWRLPNWLLALGATEAHAADLKMDIDTPVIREIIGRRKERFAKIDALLSKGFIGEGKDGLLKEKDKGVLELKELAKARKLVKEENADRVSLYEEIGKANNLAKEQHDDLRRVFAEENKKQLKVGQYYELPDGTWKKKIPKKD